MKKIISSVLLCLTSAIAFCQTNNADIAIIPQPVSLTKTTGVFSLPQTIVIEAPVTQEMKEVTRFLKERLSVATGINVTVQNAAPSAAIQLLLNKPQDAVIGKEGYNLSVTSKNSIIKANTAAG